MFQRPLQLPLAHAARQIRPQKCFHGSCRIREPQINLLPAEKTRNIGIIAHIDAGKTTTSERMLFYSGKTARIGNVDQGDTVTDYLPSERQRGITIQLAAISIPWNGHKINIIDTPGHADFTFEVTRSLRVLDGAVTILDAVAGVEAQTQKVWRQAADLGIPRIAYINKMDRPGAGFGRTVKEIVARLQTRVVLVNLPFFSEENGENKFRGLVDVVHQKLLVWDASDETGQSMVARDITGDMPEFPGVYEMLTKSRECMVETLGELDDTVIEEFFETEDYCAVSASTIHRAIQKATLAGVVTPVLCGSSFKNVGVQPLMDAVVAYLPSPLQTLIPEISAKRTGSGKKSRKAAKFGMSSVPAEMGKNGLLVNRNPNLTLALAFKVMSHPARGTLTFFRVYSGRLASNSTVINTRTGKKIHLKKLMLMHGDSPEEVRSILAGNIGVVAGTQDEITTGDTLVLHGMTSLKSFSDFESNLTLLPIEIPPPLFNSSIEPATAGDARYMADCINVLLKEDPSLGVHIDEELGQTVLSGMGELHLEITRDRLVNDMKAKVRLRDVAVSYKESVSKPDSSVVAVRNDAVEVEISLDSFEGAASESAEEDAILTEIDNNIVVMGETAAAPCMQEIFENRRWKCESSLEELQETLLSGVLTGMQMGGPIFGLPLHSCVVRVHRWSFPAEEKDVPVQLLLDAGRRAVSKAIEELYAKNENNFCILEPIMETKVTVESDFLGDVVHDLNTRCLATIISIEDDGMELETQNWAHAEAEKIYVPPDYTMKNTGFSVRNRKNILAETPLREMVGYLSRLRSMTQGHGVFDMSYKGMRRATQTRMNSIRSEVQF